VCVEGGGEGCRCRVQNAQRPIHRYLPPPTHFHAHMRGPLRCNLNARCSHDVTLLAPVPPHPDTHTAPALLGASRADQLDDGRGGDEEGDLGVLDPVNIMWELAQRRKKVCAFTVLLLETLRSKVFTGRVSSFQGFFNCLPVASKFVRGFQMVYRLKI
jgi:hypothetical protein